MKTIESVNSRFVRFFLLSLCLAGSAVAQAVVPQAGAIYFDGWGNTHHESTMNDGALLKSYPERAPAWGYYNNSPAYMEQEITAAVGGGLKFFAFLYYTALDSQPDGNYKSNPRNACFNNYFNASNYKDIQWCMYFINNAPYNPTLAYWKQIIDWLGSTGYFKNSKYLKVNGKPVFLVFNPSNFTPDVMAYLRAEIAAEGFPGCYVIATGASGGAGWDAHTSYNIQGGTGAMTQAQMRAANLNFLNTGTATDPVLAIAENGWDDRPWVNNPVCYDTGRSCTEFEANLNSVIGWMNTPANSGKFLSNLLLINAWNEIGEGGLLIPTVSEQSDHLKALNKVLNGIPYSRIAPPYPLYAAVNQAASMGMSPTYTTEANGAADGGMLAKMTTINEQGAIWGTFAGTSGQYTIDIHYFDESDGTSTSDLYVGGRLIGSWSWAANNDTFQIKTFSNVSINSGDVVKVISYDDSGEYARLDYLSIHP